MAQHRNYARTAVYLLESSASCVYRMQTQFPKEVSYFQLLELLEESRTFLTAN